MKFEEIVSALREGKKIRRKDIVWQNYYGFLFVIENKNKIFSNSAGNDDYKLTKEDLKDDNWEIVKETKKIKIRDMTESQYLKFRKKYCGYETCSTTCPFRYINCSMGWWKHKDQYSDKFLDQEVEIEE